MSLISSCRNVQRNLFGNFLSRLKTQNSKPNDGNMHFTYSKLRAIHSASRQYSHSSNWLNQRNANNLLLSSIRCQIHTSTSLLDEYASDGSSGNEESHGSEFDQSVIGVDNKDPTDQVSSKQNKVYASSSFMDDMKPVNGSEIREFLTDKGMHYEDGHTCYITACPRFMKKSLVFKRVDKLYINSKTGYFVCQNCKANGPWHLLKDNIITLVEKMNDRKRNLPECFCDLIMEDSKERKKLESFWEGLHNIDQLAEEEWELLQQEIGILHLNKESLQVYGVRATADHKGLVVPSYHPDGKLAGVRIYLVSHYTYQGQEKSRLYTRTIPKVQYNCLFGIPQLSADAKDVVITGTDWDAIAVYQATGKGALALPKGDSILPQEVLPFLEQFSHITLWLGGELKEFESARQFARKLNDQRCSVIRPDNKHPNALRAIQHELNVPSILKDAKHVSHKCIITFSSLRQDVFSELSQAEQVAGVKWQRYPKLNTLLKGHRRGELTVFTGPTGSGKTTFISDYSLDLCMKGVNTLWGSFEINNVRLMKTMIRQFSQVNLVKQLDEYEHWADKFEQLPMYFMTFHGQENIRMVIETMSHAVYVHDIAHVIVDNLQFMMGVGGTNASDRFLKQDHIITAFRKFATNMNCHVTLVIHPRKEKEDELTVQSIFGSAKASQEADNILILQDKRLTTVRGRKYVQVAKNRFDGELGLVMLKFNKDSLSFFKDKSKEDEGKDDT